MYPKRIVFPTIAVAMLIAASCFLVAAADDSSLARQDFVCSCISPSDSSSCTHCRPFSERQQEEAADPAFFFSVGNNNNNNNSQSTTISCWNLGTPTASGTSCDCDKIAGWIGPRCDTRVCAQHPNAAAAKDHGATTKATYVHTDSKTNTCAGQCQAGWSGLNCESCEADSSCAPDEFCDASLLVPGPDTEQANMQCDVTSVLFNRLLGADVTGIAAFNCRLPNRTHKMTNEADSGGKASAAGGGGSGASGSGSGEDGESEKNGNCSLSFFRQMGTAATGAGAASAPKLVDNYFHCELQKCGTTHETVLGHESPTATKNTALAYSIAQVFVIILLLGFIIIGFVKSRPLRMLLVAILGTASLGLIFLLVCTIWFVSASDRSQSITHVIRYDCDVSHCACFNHSGLPASVDADSCLSKDFGRNLIPQLRSGMWLKCEVKTTLVNNGQLTLDSGEQKCTFLQKDLNSEVDLQCTGRTCQKRKIDWNSWVGSKVVKQNETSDDRSKSSFHFSTLIRNKDVATGLLVMFAVLLVGGGCYWLHAVQRSSRDAEAEFQESFLGGGAGAALGGSPQRRSNGMATNSSNTMMMSASADELHRSRSPSIATTCQSSSAAHPMSPDDRLRFPAAAAPGAKSSLPSSGASQLDDLFGVESNSPRGGGGGDEGDGVAAAASSESNINNSNSSTAVKDNSGVTIRLVSSSKQPVDLDTSMSISAIDFSYSVPDTTTSTATTTDGNERQQTVAGAAAATTGEEAALPDDEKKKLAVTRILRNVTLHLQAGQLVAIKGVSGSSKTTMIDALAGLLPGNHSHASTSVYSHNVFDSKPRNDFDGQQLHREPAVSGSILVDGRDIFPNPLSHGAITTEFRAYCACSSIVAQQDILIDALTVREMLYYAARLKLPAALTAEQLAEIVQLVIELMRLGDVADRIIGGDVVGRGLSGGERRRCSIGVELVGLPRVLLCDEPVSSLDSVSALSVVECLADIAAGRSKLFGHPALGSYAQYRPLVVMSVHQESESIYSLFDTVLLMNKGRLVVCCPAPSALPFLLEHIRPELMTGTATNARMTVPERILSVSEFEEHELDVCVRATEQSMLAALKAADVPSRFWSEHRDALAQRADAAQRRAEQGSSGHRRLVAANNWMMIRDVEGAAYSNFLGRNGPTAASLQDGDGAGGRRGNSSRNDEAEFSPVSRMQLAALHRQRFALNWGAQVGYLSLRGWRAAVCSYHLIFAHSVATLFVGVMLAVAYHAEPLDLSGALNRAGSITYMLLVTAFLSLSVCDWVVGERRLRAHEMRNGCYSTPQYLLSKVLTDLIPLRVIPSILLSILVYAPMGLRTDGGSYFMWFCAINVLFACQVVGMVITCGALCRSFGSAALLSAVLVLVCFVFCGLLIQASTLPAIFIPFRDISPFYNAFSAQMSNVLDGLTCLFNPSGADGRPSGTAITLYCRQFLLNTGVVPDMFVQNVMLLAFFTGLFFVMAGLALNGVPEWVYLWRQKLYSCCPCLLKKPTSSSLSSRREDGDDNDGDQQQQQPQYTSDGVTYTALGGGRRQAATIVDDETDDSDDARQALVH